MNKKIGLICVIGNDNFNLNKFENLNRYTFDLNLIDEYKVNKAIVTICIFPIVLLSAPKIYVFNKFLIKIDLN